MYVDRAGEFEQAPVEVGPPFAADPRSLEPVQPVEGPLRAPAGVAEAGPMRNAARATKGLIPLCHSRRRYLSKS